MAQFIDDWLHKFPHEAGPASDPAMIDEIGRRMGAAIPEELAAVWRRVDGIHFPTLWADFVGPSVALKWITSGGWPEEFVTPGFVPIFDDRQSNIVALAVKEPYAPRVVFLPHDGDHRLLFRDLERFGRLWPRPDPGDEDAAGLLHEDEGDYTADVPRTPEDRAVARLLLETDDEHHEWYYAIQLLDEADLEQWKMVLETDHFVRRYAVARLAKMRSPEAVELLARDRTEYEAFASRLTEALEKAGLGPVERSRDNLRVGDGWIMLDGYFYLRDMPDALATLVEWFDRRRKGLPVNVDGYRLPHKRPRNGVW
jgi:hypothetical protein